MTLKEMARKAKKMDNILRDLLDDEEFYGDWCLDFPDEADEEQLEWLLKDDEELYDDLFKKFMNLVKIEFKRY